MPHLLRPIASALITVVGITACTTSDLDPDAAVAIEGAVTAPGGGPATGATVVLVRRPSPADVVGGLYAGLVSVGIACVLEPEPRLCDEGNARRTTTDTEGRYRYDLTGRDTQDSLGFANDFVLSAAATAASAEVGGPRVDARFLIQDEQLRIPPLAMWRPDLTAGGAGGTATVTWSVPPASLGVPDVITFDDGIGGVLWEQPVTGSTTTSLDARLLEASIGAVSVATRREEPIAGSTMEVRHHSPRSGFRATGPLPVTRDRPCLVVDRASGQRIARSPCALTDGQFLEPALPEHDEAVIDLGTPHQLTLVALRGCADACVVEIAADRAALDEGRWLALATMAAPAASLTTSGSPPARFLRVRAETGATVGPLTELSAWTGPPAGSIDLLDPDQLRVAAAEPPGGSRVLEALDDEDDGPSSLLVLVAAFAVVGVVAAGAYLLGRRRT